MSLVMMLGFLVAQTVKNLPAMQETRVRSLGQETEGERGRDDWMASPTQWT